MTCDHTGVADRSESQPVDCCVVKKLLCDFDIKS